MEAQKLNIRETIMSIVWPTLGTIGLFKLLDDLGLHIPWPEPYYLAVLLLAWNTFATIREYRVKRTL